MENIKFESTPPDKDKATGTSEINCFENILLISDFGFKIFLEKLNSNFFFLIIHCS